MNLYNEVFSPDVVTAGAVFASGITSLCKLWNRQAVHRLYLAGDPNRCDKKSEQRERVSREATGFFLADPRGALVAARRMNGIIQLPNAELVPSSIVP